MRKLINLFKVKRTTTEAMTGKYRPVRASEFYGKSRSAE